MGDTRMKNQLAVRQEFWGLVLGVLILFGLYVISLHNYLLFHILAELFSIVVACGIFLLAWNSQRFLDNTYLLFIGVAYLFIGATDLVHTLSYKGMGVFQGFDANLPTQLWIAGRYVQSLSFLAAFFFLNRRPNTRLVFSGYTLVTSLLFLSIFYWNIFPTCFVEGKGLTSFKIISEYLVSLFFFTSILILLKNRQKFDRAVLQWLILSLLATVGSELFFTFYISVYGLSNLGGHLLKILSFYFVYKAIIETGLAKPYTLLFRNLREERDKAQTYLDIAGVIFLVINPDQTVALINKKGREVLGYEEKEIIGKNWFDTFLPEWDRERVKENFIKLISGEIETIEYFESLVLTKGGEERIVAWHNTVLRNGKNQIVGTLNSGEDITKNKEMEKILAHLASFPKLNPNPIVEVDFNGSLHYLNPAAQQLFSKAQTKDVPREWLADLGSITPNVQSQNKISSEREIQINGNWYHQSFHVIPGLDRIRIYSLDITERKRAEEALRESEERLKRSQEIAHLGSWELDLVHNWLTWSDEVYRMFGLQPQKFGATYEAFLERVHPDDRAAVDAAYSGSLRENRDTYEIEHRVVRNDTGDIRVVHEKCEHFRDATGKIIRSVGMVHDITERKQMEEELRKSRDELEIRVQERTAELSKTYQKLEEQSKILEAFFSSTVTPLVFLDRNFNFVRVNEAYAKACQRAVSEFPGHNHFEFYPSNAKAIFEKVVETKIPHQAIAKPFVFPDHPEWETTYWNWTLTPLLDNAGEVEFLVFTLQDVTDRERALQKTQEQAALLELAHDAVIVRDMEDRILFWNRGAEEMYGWAKHEAQDRVVHDLLQTEFPKHPDEIKIDLIRKGYWEGELLHTRRDGQRIIVESRWVLQRGKEGYPSAILGINHDITEPKELQRRVEATNAILSLFVRMASRKDYLDGALGLLQNWSSSRCAGIRVMNDKGYIPYESYVGFSHEFWESENWLSARNDQCTCIRVITGTSDHQDHPMMTPAGSFRCDNMFEFVGQLPDEEKARFRGVCIQNGFKSVAIIPIRRREKILGVIHLADEKEGSFPLKIVEFIESVAPLIGEAVNRFNLEEELRESENRLRLLSSRLLTVQEQERKRVAHELHDGIGQILTAVKFKVEDTLQQMAKSKGRSKGALETIVPVIQQAVEEVRRIQMDLRPSLLDDIGILATIGWFTREFQKVYTSIQIEKAIDIKEEEVPDSLKVVIFRVIQEGLNNIAKHSEANVASLFLRKSDGKLELAIGDNGQGFDLDGVRSTESPEKGFGLSSMRERTELSGGRFSIVSTIGAGTTIRATWPL
jgi:PAS domain S-box-containing protein